MADTTTTIIWRDRTIEIKPPGAMQLATWSRIADQAQEIGSKKGKLTSDEKKEMVVLLDRLLRIIRSLFTKSEDRQWLEDLLIDGEVTDEDLLEMFTQMTDEMTDASTTKAKPKATRRT